MRESKFQATLIKELKSIFKGCLILKNDPTYIQGIPDLIILYKDKWAMLECKASAHASVRPNQDFYIRKTNEMSYGAFIYPENKDVIINALKKVFQKKSSRPRISRSKQLPLVTVRQTETDRNVS